MCVNYIYDYNMIVSYSYHKLMMIINTDGRKQSYKTSTCNVKHFQNFQSQKN
jgi:hypothetical protein